MYSRLVKFSLFLMVLTGRLGADNQTATLSPILPGGNLPFTISIEQESFTLPNGLHSFASAIYNNQWLLLAGRTNGLHGFSNTPDNFPPSKQNTTVYVVNPNTGVTFFKSLNDPTSGLTQRQVDLLSVTSPQSYQQGSTLYISGGYGVDTATGLFSTKDTLTAVDIPGLMHWVANASPGETAAQHIRQTSHPLLQVTGGYMSQANGHAPTLLVFGQNFQGFYLDSSNGSYTQQVRAFRIIDSGRNLYIQPKKPPPQNPSFRRRDLNVVPVMEKVRTTLQPAFVALSGVFTTTIGVWTVPVHITGEGAATMADPSNPNTFKQGMNNYVCPTVGLFSKKHSNMYISLLGGISFGFFTNGVFFTDPEIPFINQITTVKIDKHQNYQQFLMANEYPVIPSTGVNPGNPLIFGAGAAFMPATNLPIYDNGVFQLDKLGHGPVVLGYVVGGIQSTLPNTNTDADSSASAYVFRVILSPQ